jgi:lactoylglutathione lyase
VLEQLTKLNDICLFVEDLATCEAFYVEKLGFRVRRIQPGYREFVFQNTSVTMWEKPGVFAALPEEVLGPVGHHFMLAVRLPSYADVDTLWAELMEKEVPTISPPTSYPWGARAAYFKDPEGNIWEIFSWEEGEGPGLVDEGNVRSTE